MTIGCTIGSLDNIGTFQQVFVDPSTDEYKLGQYIIAPTQFIEDLGNVNALSDEVDVTLARFVWLLAFKPFNAWDFAAMKGTHLHDISSVYSYLNLTIGIALGTDNVARSFVLTRPIDWTPFTNANHTLPLLIVFGKHDALFS